MTASALCLALAIYFEARNQPIEGQVAVAHVVLNRIKDKRWSDNACDVVYARHQFSFYWDGKSDRPREPNAWRMAQDLASKVFELPDPTSGATHYHSTGVQPYWSRCLVPTQVIGDHVFFKL